MSSEHRNDVLEEAAKVCESGEVFGSDEFCRILNEFKKAQAKRIRALKSE